MTILWSKKGLGGGKESRKGEKSRNVKDFTAYPYFCIVLIFSLPYQFSIFDNSLHTTAQDFLSAFSVLLGDPNTLKFALMVRETIQPVSLLRVFLSFNSIISIRVLSLALRQGLRSRTGVCRFSNRIDGGSQGGSIIFCQTKFNYFQKF